MVSTSSSSFFTTTGDPFTGVRACAFGAAALLADCSCFLAAGAGLSFFGWTLGLGTAGGGAAAAVDTGTGAAADCTVVVAGAEDRASHAALSIVAWLKPVGVAKKSSRSSSPDGELVLRARLRIDSLRGYSPILSKATTPLGLSATLMGGEPDRAYLNPKTLPRAKDDTQSVLLEGSYTACEKCSGTGDGGGATNLMVDRTARSTVI